MNYQIVIIVVIIIIVIVVVVIIGSINYVDPHSMSFFKMFL